MSDDQNNLTTPPSDPNSEAGQNNSKAPDGDKDQNFQALRKQNDKLLKQVETLTKAAEESKNDKLKEEGKWKDLYEGEKKKSDDLSAQLLTTTRQILLEKEVAKTGINSDAVDLIIPSLLSQVEFDENNTPKNLTTVIENLKTTKPSLFSAEQLKPVPIAGKVGASVTVSNNNQISGDEALKIIASGNADEIAKINL